jgi:serine/threonine-protein kinase
MRLRLTFRAGHQQGQVFELSGPGEVVLGRSSECDLQIYDERVSRRHCALVLEANRVRLADMGSGNGTRVNGVEARDRVLATGDVLGLGETELELQLLPAATGGGARRATCAWCRAAIPDHLLAAGAEVGGQCVCVRCVPRFQVPGYAIDGLIGRGQSSVVYRAQDLARGGSVALKALWTRGSVHPEERASWLRSFEPVAALRHPNVVAVLDHGWPDPCAYQVLELVPGQSLRALVAQHGPLPLESALRVGQQVAQALACAHARRIVHGDVRPQNVLVQDDGRTKLRDFGLWRLPGRTRGPDVVTLGSGASLNPYMPPERLEDTRRASVRGEVYSFGATVYHALTARPPFPTRTPMEFFHALRRESPPPVGSVRSDVPAHVEEAIATCLAKLPEERYPGVEDAAAQLHP